MTHHEVTAAEGIFEDVGFKGGIVFTGTARSWQPSADIMQKLHASSVPTLHAPYETTDAIEMIQKATHKLNATDRRRTDAAIQHVHRHVDLDFVLTGKSRA